MTTMLATTTAIGSVIDLVTDIESRMAPIHDVRRSPQSNKSYLDLTLFDLYTIPASHPSGHTKLLTRKPARHHGYPQFLLDQAPSANGAFVFTEFLPDTAMRYEWMQKNGANYFCGINHETNEELFALGPLTKVEQETWEALAKDCERQFHLDRFCDPEDKPSVDVLKRVFLNSLDENDITSAVELAAQQSDLQALDTLNDWMTTLKEQSEFSFIHTVRLPEKTDAITFPLESSPNSIDTTCYTTLLSHAEEVIENLGLDDLKSFIANTGNDTVLRLLALIVCERHDGDFALDYYFKGLLGLDLPTKSFVRSPFTFFLDERGRPKNTKHGPELIKKIEEYFAAGKGKDISYDWLYYLRVMARHSETCAKAYLEFCANGQGLTMEHFEPYGEPKLATLSFGHIATDFPSLPKSLFIAAGEGFLKIAKKRRRFTAQELAKIKEFYEACTGVKLP